MAVGIPGFGWAGWIIAFALYSQNAGVAIYVSIQAALFSIFALGSLVLLKKVIEEQ